MNRREWLTKTSLALASGLVLGDVAMDAYERLSHKKVFALGEIGRRETVREQLEQQYRRAFGVSGTGFIAGDRVAFIRHGNTSLTGFGTITCANPLVIRFDT